MLVLRAASVGAAFFLHAAVVSAQPAPQPLTRDSVATDTISPPLRDAVRAVWKSSPEVQAARAALNAAEARARAAAQPTYNPSLSLDVENADVDRRVGGVSLAIDVSGKRRARTEQGDAQRRASEALFNVTRRDVAGRWLKAWASTTMSLRQLKIGRQRVELMRRFDALAAQRLQVGDISSPERDLAGLALGEAQIQQATLAGATFAADAALIAIVGDVAIITPPLPERAPPATSAMPPKPFTEMPELVEARARLEVADAGIEVAKSARKSDPVVSLIGGQVRSGPTTDRVIGFNVSIPLPVLNSGHAEVDAARAEADEAAASMHVRRFAVIGAQQQMQLRYDALRNAADAFQSGRAGAFADRTALLEKLWRAGEIGTSDYLVQLKQSLDFALTALELESQTWQAWFDYLAAAGRLIDWIDGNSQDTPR